MKISIDFETYSECDLTAHGAWVYSRHPSTRVLCSSHAFANDAPELEFDTDAIKDNLKWLLRQKDEARFHAFNSFFECCIIANVLKMPDLIDFNQWHDTMSAACAAAWPQALGHITTAMPFDEQYRKDKAGKKLIQQLCMPQKITKGPDKGELISPEVYWGDDYAELLSQLGDYCVQDVIAEREVGSRLRPLSKTERKVWIANQELNWRGMKCDVPFATTAYKLYLKSKEAQLERIQEITGLDNPNSRAQVQGWLNEHSGIQFANMQSETLQQALKTYGKVMTAEAEEVVSLRLTSARTPPTKFLSMIAKADRQDQRIRGMQIYHAASTGRSASRGVNTMNLPRPVFSDYKTAVKLVKQRDLELIELCYGAPIDTLCSVIRPALTATKGRRLVAVDYSSIESRVLHWLAGAEDTLAEIRRGDDEGDSSRIYKVAASGVFDMLPDDVEKGTDQYQGGKVTELACGFGGSYHALGTMADSYHIDIVVPDGFRAKPWLKEKMAWHNEDRAKDKKPKMTLLQAYQLYVVLKWRKANPHVVQLWEECENAALTAVQNPGRKVPVGDHLIFKAGKYKGTSNLWVRLPSGRLLSYVQPHIRKGKFGPQVNFFGINSTTRQWCRQSTYGGKLAENVVQASARDVLEAAVLRLKGTAYNDIVLTVYDEIVSDVPDGVGSAEEMSAIMCEHEPWMDGLPVVAHGTELKRYWK